MNDSYYDKMIEQEKRKINVLVRVIDVAMDYLEPKNKRKQNILRSAWTKVKYAETSKERSARLATFLHDLNDKGAFKEKITSSHEVSQTLRNRLRGTNIELEYSEYSDYSYEISSQTKMAIAKFAREYVDSVNRIDSLKRQKENDRKRAQERKNQEDLEALREQRRVDSSSTRSYDDVYATVPSSRSVKDDKVNVVVNGEVIFHEYDEFEVRERKAIEFLEKKIASAKARGYGNFFLTVDEEKMLRRVLGDGKYLHVGKLLEEGLSVQDVLYHLQQYEREVKIPFKKPNYRPNIDDVFMAASSIYRYLPEELMLPSYSLEKEGKFEIKLRNMGGMSKGLETYEKIYAIYLNYFNRLSDEEKDKIKSSFMTDGAYEYYKKQFKINSFEIISPSKLKTYVNAKIREEMLNNFTMYMDNEANHYNALVRATTYMSVDELANLYLAIKAKYNTYSVVYPGKDEQIQLQAQAENRRNLQENFVSVILLKMNLGNLSLEERKRKIEYIVKEILHENNSLEMTERTLETETVEEKREEVKEETATVKSEDGMYHYEAGGQKQKTTNRAMAARYNAQHRFFGMSKLEQTVARMSGKWSTFKRLWDQAMTMDKEEQEEVAQKLDLMFRR